MALLLHYDFNTAACLDNWTVVTSGNGVLEWQSTIGRDAGGGIFRRTSSYAQVSTGLANLAAGQSIFVGQWVKKIVSPPTWQSYNIRMFTGLFYGIRMWDGVFNLMLTSGSATFIIAELASANMELNRWYYVVVEFKRSSGSGIADGGVRIWRDGVMVADKRMYDTYGKYSIGSFMLGSSLAQNIDGGDYAFDDVRIGDTLADVEPALPPVDGELPQPARTLVLFNRTSADSEIIARSLVPDTNLVSLPCSTNETLANYATFQNEVETPLKNFLAARPLLASQITCIIAGYRVPGFFAHDGETLSAVSRLADIDNVFISEKDNPLSGVVERLTATVLQAAGVRLAARLDANTLADCQTLKSLGEAAVNVVEGEKYYTTESHTLDEQMLRLPFETITTDTEISGDAIVYMAQDITVSSIGAIAGNSRLSYVFTVDASGLLKTRTGISALATQGFRSMIFAGKNFDIAPFCKMLRIGGTVAEAFAVACQKLNADAQFAAWPFMTASFPKAGYNIYLGDGSPVDIDYSQPHAALPEISGEFEMAISHKPNSVRAMCARKVSSAGQEETHGRVLMLCANSGGWINLQLPVPYDLTTRNVCGDNVELSFSCVVHEGQEPPEYFEILGDNGSGEIDRVAPVAVIPFMQDEREYAVSIEVANRPAIFTVRARLDVRTGDEAAAVNVLPLRIPVKPEVLI